MGVNDFLLNYYGAYRDAASQDANGQITPPKSVGLKMPKTNSGGLGLQKPTPPQPGSGYGFEPTQVTSNPELAGQFPASMMQYSLMSDKSATDQAFQQSQQSQQQQVAAQYGQMAAGVKGANQYGVQQQSPLDTTDYADQQLQNLGAISQVGSNALQGAQNAQQFQQEQNQINANVGYQISYTGTPYDSSYTPAGASSNNIAGQAIAMAMTAMNNHVPYKWGGQDLNSGVDCSGLLYSIYNKLGIALPRTTYEQAKYGKIIHGLNNALPGDLIFYNTGSADPNGIGVNSHVGMYLGNGMIIEAYDPQRGIIEAPVGNYNGTIMRPW